MSKAVANPNDEDELTEEEDLALLEAAKTQRRSSSFGSRLTRRRRPSHCAAAPALLDPVMEVETKKKIKRRGSGGSNRNDSNESVGGAGEATGEEETAYVSLSDYCEFKHYPELQSKDFRWNSVVGPKARSQPDQVVSDDEEEEDDIYFSTSSKIDIDPKGDDPTNYSVKGDSAFEAMCAPDGSVFEAADSQSSNKQVLDTPTTEAKLRVSPQPPETLPPQSSGGSEPNGEPKPPSLPQTPAPTQHLNADMTGLPDTAPGSKRGISGSDVGSTLRAMPQRSDTPSKHLNKPLPQIPSAQQQKVTKIDVKPAVKLGADNYKDDEDPYSLIDSEDKLDTKQYGPLDDQGDAYASLTHNTRNSSQMYTSHEISDKPQIPRLMIPDPPMIDPKPLSEEGYDVYSTIGDEELKPNTNYLSVYSSVLKKKPKAMEADRPLPLPPRKVTIADPGGMGIKLPSKKRSSKGQKQEDQDDSDEETVPQYWSLQSSEPLTSTQRRQTVANRQSIAPVRTGTYEDGRRISAFNHGFSDELLKGSGMHSLPEMADSNQSSGNFKKSTQKDAVQDLGHRKGSKSSISMGQKRFSQAVDRAMDKEQTEKSRRILRGLKQDNPSIDPEKGMKKKVMIAFLTVTQLFTKGKDQDKDKKDKKKPSLKCFSCGMFNCKKSH